MKITERNYKKASLEDWQKGFHALYGHIDDKRSIDSIWRHALVNASRVSTDIRKRNFGLAFEHLAHLTNWIMTTVQRCHDSKRLDGHDLFSTSRTISQIIWDKYPGACPYCRTAPCSCATPGRVEKGNVQHLFKGKKSGRKRPQTIDGWYEMFDRIYSNAHAITSIEELTSHFFEETGEVAHEITRITEVINGRGAKEKKEDFFDEVADVFSWVCSLVSKIHHGYLEPAASHFEKGQRISHRMETLSQIIWNTYGSPHGLICPLCKRTPCACQATLKF